MMLLYCCNRDISLSLIKGHVGSVDVVNVSLEQAKLWVASLLYWLASVRRLIYNILFIFSSFYVGRYTFM